ncbi:hypothetical protein [Alteribacter aurantiacus]|uniref:hypothetical protein n=1 Tax=Alteribacter aurantiacus TaxID=254410 RepID=UPI000478B63C|nr:hypothetical protein [Alteribacter aurantiacus]
MFSVLFLLMAAIERGDPMVIDKLMSALIISIAVSLVVSFIFMGEYSLFIIIFIYASPVIFISGLILSRLIEGIVKKLDLNSKKLRYLTSFTLFAMGGLLTNVFLYLDVLNNGLHGESFVLVAFGIIVSLAFYHTTLAINRLLNTFA